MVCASRPLPGRSARPRRVSHDVDPATLSSTAGVSHRRCRACSTAIRADGARGELGDTSSRARPWLWTALRPRCWMPPRVNTDCGGTVTRILRSERLAACVLIAAAFLAGDFRAVSSADQSPGPTAARPGSVEGDRSVVRVGGFVPNTISIFGPRLNKTHLVVGEGRVRLLRERKEYLKLKVRLLARPREDPDSPLEVLRSVIATTDRPVEGIGALVMTRCRTDLRYKTSVRAWSRHTTDDPWDGLRSPRHWRELVRPLPLTRDER